MLRTVDYVDAYSLTVLRIAALVWMALVAIGLVLICWRLLRGRSGAWLINANVLAAAARPRRLLPASISARSRRPGTCAMPARSAAAASSSTSAICSELGPSALLPLIELESRPLPAGASATGCSGVRSRIDGPARRRPGRLARLDPAQRRPPRRGATIVAERRLPRLRRHRHATAAAAAGAAATTDRRDATPSPRSRRIADDAAATPATSPFDSACRRGEEMYAMSHQILIVDDDPHIRQVLSLRARQGGDADRGGGRRRGRAGRSRRSGPTWSCSTSTCRG